MLRLAVAIALTLFCLRTAAADPATSTPSTAVAPTATPLPTPHQVPPPTIADLPYGPHPKQVLDFYQALSDKPTPLVFYIHGGGWTHGEKRPVNVAAYLKEGISVVSIQYRFTSDADAEGFWPPVEWPMHDAARALQLVRSKAADWNIDKKRIGATGGSAGACTSLWLAFHDDLADPKSNDPISRESTRLWCAAVDAPQTTLDPQQMKEWTPNSKYGGHAFGFRGDSAKKSTPFDEFLLGREKVLPWIKEYSPYELVTSDDPPIYMTFKAAPAIGQDQQDPTHTANFGLKLQEHCREKGVSCELVYPGAPNVQHPSIQAFLIEKLKQ
jgi:acetyl esterase/lipase